MGARQSVSEERQRSNSLDVVTPSSSEHRQHAASTSMTPAELLQVLRQNTRVVSPSNSNDDEEMSTSSNHRSLRPRMRGGSQGHPSVRVRSQTSRRSVPLFMLATEDLQCPICHKTVASDEAEIHFVMCLTRPKLSYNDDVLTDNKGECPICFDEMEAGQTIARLPCLCIYHKNCIDDWFKQKNSCPEHPGDD